MALLLAMRSISEMPRQIMDKAQMSCSLFVPYPLCVSYMYHQVAKPAIAIILSGSSANP